VLGYSKLLETLGTENHDWNGNTQRKCLHSSLTTRHEKVNLLFDLSVTWRISVK
jgi:hypothetical protein